MREKEITLSEVLDFLKSHPELLEPFDEVGLFGGLVEKGKTRHDIDLYIRVDCRKMPEINVEEAMYKLELALFERFHAFIHRFSNTCGSCSMFTNEFGGVWRTISCKKLERLIREEKKEGAYYRVK